MPNSSPRVPPPLLDPVGESLRGAHAALARARGRVLAYDPEVASFTALPQRPDADDWAALRDLVGGPGQLADLFSNPVTPPDDWEHVFELEGFQMVLSEVAADRLTATTRAVVGTVELTATDAAEMIALVERTRPGPFRARTHELGGFVGVRPSGSDALLAMAGQRLRPPGWCEISAVCAAPEARGRGYAAAVVEAVALEILRRGERPFLHVARANTAALGLYRRLGFEVTAPVTFRGFRTP